MKLPGKNYYLNAINLQKYAFAAKSFLGDRAAAQLVAAPWPLYSILVLFMVFTFSSASFWPDDQDGVNYLLGIDRYDVAFHQPHFPGYPVYIAAGKILTALSGPPEMASVILSVFSGTLCLWLFSSLIIRRFGRETALICTLALALNPVFFEFSHKIFTEIPALALLLASIVILGDPVKASGRKWFLSSIVMGLMLGIRLSWWPFAIFYFIKGYLHEKKLYSSAGLFIGILCWLVPQAAYVGPKELLATGISFTFGHFNQWGGAVGSVTGTDHRFFSFAARIGEAIGWIGTGTFWTLLPWVFFTIFCFIMGIRFKNHEKQAGTFIAATVFYLAWVAIGQNTEKVRHLMPVVPVFILIIAPVLKQNLKIAWAVILVFSLTLPLDYATRTEKNPPAIQFRQWLNDQPVSNVEFFCGNSERFFDRYFSKARVVNVDFVDNLPFVIKSSWPGSMEKFICDDIPGFKPAGSPAAVFPARKGDPVDRTLRIYKLTTQVQGSRLKALHKAL